MSKYKVELSRLVEQEAVVWVEARDPDEAADNALDYAEAGEVVWHQSDTEPHTLSAERVLDAGEFQEAEFVPTVRVSPSDEDVAHDESAAND